MTGTEPTGYPQPRLVKVVLVALLTGGVIIGLRGGLALHGWHGRFRGDSVAIGITLEVILAGLLAVVLIRGRQAGGDQLAAKLRAVLRPVLTGGLVIIPLILLLYTPLRGHPLPHPLPSGGQASPLPLPTARPSAQRSSGTVHLPIADVLYALLALAVLAGIGYCVILLRRRPAGLPGALDEGLLADSQRSELRAAVESGRRALATLSDAQAAIIACYVAMERSLAAAGAARGQADTPSEFLDRAAGAGLVRGSAAGELTGLFYEARFSAHQMTPAQRDAAETALSQLAADLRHGAAARQPATGPGGPGEPGGPG